MKKTLYSLLVFVSLLMGATGCKTSQTGGSTDGTKSASHGMEVNNMANLLKAEPSDWTTIQVPMTVKLDIPVSFKASSKVYMTRDSSIYISFAMLGMEMAAIQITTDSIFGIDKMNKRYIAESLRSVTSNYPVSISTLQDMFMGQIFLPGVTPLTSKNSRDFETFSVDSGKWIAVPVKQFNPYALSFTFSNDTLLSTTVASPESAFMISYSEPAECLGKPLPQTNQLKVATEKLQIMASMTWNWKKARVNNPSDNKKIKINPSYKRVSALELLKSFN